MTTAEIAETAETKKSRREEGTVSSIRACAKKSNVSRTECGLLVQFLPLAPSRSGIARPDGIWPRDTGGGQGRRIPLYPPPRVSVGDPKRERSKFPHLPPRPLIPGRDPDPPVRRRTEPDRHHPPAHRAGATGPAEGPLGPTSLAAGGDEPTVRSTPRGDRRRARRIGRAGPRDFAGRGDRSTDGPSMERAQAESSVRAQKAPAPRRRRADPGGPGRDPGRSADRSVRLSPMQASIRPSGLKTGRYAFPGRGCRPLRYEQALEHESRPGHDRAWGKPEDASVSSERRAHYRPRWIVEEQSAYPAVSNRSMPGGAVATLRAHEIGNGGVPLWRRSQTSGLIDDARARD